MRSIDQLKLVFTLPNLDFENNRFFPRYESSYKQEAHDGPEFAHQQKLAHFCQGFPLQKRFRWKVQGKYILTVLWR